MGQYLIDNNVISNYFSGSLPPDGMKFISRVIDEVPNLSVITEIEALSWINPDKKKEQIVVEFISESNIIGLDPAIVARCIAIRRSRKIKTPDAILAATAIVHNFTLITSDTDLGDVSGLQVIDPMRL